MFPKKHLGQNFLKNEQIADRIIEAANLTKDDTILEIGPGTGILTERLVKVVKEVWAIEKDFDLVENLRRRLSSKNLKLIHQDALWFSSHALGVNYKVVANIPYNITSPLIRKFLENEPKPESMILMVQKEVAERICAKPGDSARGLLTIIVEFYAEAEILFEVSKQEFYPVPQVDSAIIKIKVRKTEKSKVNEKLFFQIVKAGFSAKRRQIHNSLAATLRLPKDEARELLKKAQIAPNLRAEDLSLEDWERLSLSYEK